jgi:hypothetical protein
LAHITVLVIADKLLLLLPLLLPLLPWPTPPYCCSTQQLDGWATGHLGILVIADNLDVDMLLLPWPTHRPTVA